MSVFAQCPCGACFNAKPELVGKQVICPTCGQPFIVRRPPVRTQNRQRSQPAQRAAYRQPASRTLPAARTRRSEVSDSQIKLFAVLGIGGILAIGVVVILGIVVQGLVSNPTATEAEQLAEGESHEAGSSTAQSSDVSGEMLQGLADETGEDQGSISLIHQMSTRSPISEDHDPSRQSSASFSGPVASASSSAAVAPAATVASSSGTTLNMADLIELVEPSVVRIDIEGVEDGKPFKAIGSGFIVDVDGTIVTNFHVIEGARKATLTYRDGAQAEVSQYLAASKEQDLAVIRPDGDTAVRPAIAMSADLPRKGESVAAFGSPLGFDFSASEGIVSAIRRGDQVAEALRSTVGIEVYGLLEYGLETEWIQTTTPISSGNSGGPLVNMRGELVGVNTWGNAAGQNLNFASSMSEVQSLLAKVTDQGQPLTSLPHRKSLSERVADDSPSGGSRRPSLLANAEVVQPVAADAAFVAGKAPGEVSRFEGHSDAVVDIAVSRNGQYLASSGLDGKTFVFDMSTGKARYVIASPITPIRDIGFSYDPCYLVTLRAGRFDDGLRVRMASDGKQLEGFRVFNFSEVSSMDVSPDARTIAATWKDGEAHILRLDMLREDARDFEIGRWGTHFTSCVFSPDGTHLITGSADGILKAWTGAGDIVSVVGAAQGHYGYVHCLAVSADGEYVVSGGEDGQVRIWQNWKKRSWRKLSAPEGVKSEVASVACSPNGQFVAIARANRSVLLWDTEAKSIVRTISLHGAPVMAMQFTTDGRFLITGCADHVVRFLAVSG